MRNLKITMLVLVALVISISLCAKPKIRIIATGGTIAGVAASSSSSAYTAGQVGIQTLIDAVPQVKDLADVSGEQLVNIGSQDMNDQVWLKLAKRINQLLNTEGYDGVLITHGTDLLDNPSIGPGVRQQLVRIIAELINNAAKYTPPSSTVTLTIEADDNTLECMCTNPIDPGQATSTATSSQLGLFQAQQRIESLGGSLHITHTTNRWTTIFTIPLHPTPPTTTD